MNATAPETFSAWQDLQHARRLVTDAARQYRANPTEEHRQTLDAMLAAEENARVELARVAAAEGRAVAA